MASSGSSSLSRLPVVAKVGIGIALVALVTIAYFTIFYSDISSAIRSAKSQELPLKQKLEDARKIEFAYQQDLSELNKRQQLQRELNKVLPEDAAYPAFLSAVQGVANSSGVALVAWSPMAESSEEFYAKVPMQLKLTGRFHQIAKFFYGVGLLDRIINMEEIEISKPKTANGEVLVEIDCLATAFRSLPTQATAQATTSKAKAPAGKKSK